MPKQDVEEANRVNYALKYNRVELTVSKWEIRPLDGTGVVVLTGTDDNDQVWEGTFPLTSLRQVS
ncbi:hypothetical protein [Micromonospora sp. NBC_01796]|uniref:hypothetical protein n=1 Tax=Micromonospora sp. NBC_01796 TaxID=2975987 RepID=UPI002DDBC5DA|nr:hypothetical protein [Micromonospora sp. NBC_01796]WSA88084.1 hypothetical protein OIE47_10995 [Micromonospora sp. NBC_01796]